MSPAAGPRGKPAAGGIQAAGGTAGPVHGCFCALWRHGSAWGHFLSVLCSHGHTERRSPCQLQRAGSELTRKCQWPSRVLLCVTPWTVAHQAPLSMAFSRAEYWSGVQCPPPGDLPDPGIEPASLTSPALAGGFFATSATWEFTFRISGGGTFSQTRSLDPSPPPLRPPLSGL